MPRTPVTVKNPITFINKQLNSEVFADFPKILIIFHFTTSYKYSNKSIQLGFVLFIN